MDAINAEVIGPSGPVYLNFDLGPNGGRGSFQVSFSFGYSPNYSVDASRIFRIREKKPHKIHDIFRVLEDTSCPIFHSVKRFNF